jgi:sensor histidine kinase YesM
VPKKTITAVYKIGGKYTDEEKGLKMRMNKIYDKEEEERQKKKKEKV